MAFFEMISGSFKKIYLFEIDFKFIIFFYIYERKIKNDLKIFYSKFFKLKQIYFNMKKIKSKKKYSFKKEIFYLFFKNFKLNKNENIFFITQNDFLNHYLLKLNKITH